MIDGALAWSQGRGVPAIGEPGRAALEVAAGPPPQVPGVPDAVLSEYSTESLEIRAASVRGLQHRHWYQPRQDAFSVVHDPATATTVVVVCDGVGSLPRSHEAAAHVADSLPRLYWTYRDWASAIAVVNDELQERVDRTDPDADPDRHAMATTVVAAAVIAHPGGHTVQIARSDDSTVWHLDPDHGWSPVSVGTVEPEPGAVHTGSVRALPAVAPRLVHAEVAFDHGALFVMTDGVGGPLAGSPEVAATLRTWWATPPPVFEFGAQVGFARRSHMDDRTAVGLWIRPAGSPEEPAEERAE